MSLFWIAGCGESEKTERDAEAAPTAENQVEDAPDVVTEEQADYVDPSEAEDRCGVAQGLVELDEQAAAQSEDAAAGQLGERLELFAGALGQLSELASDDEEQGEWAEAESAYREAHDFYLSSGEQVANDHFLALLAEAVGAGTEAFEARQEEVQEQCGVNLGDLVPER